MNHLWIQYAYDDPKNAAVIQTADSESEARDCDRDVMDGCVWYRYDIIPGKGDGELVNPDGPHYFHLAVKRRRKA